MTRRLATASFSLVVLGCFFLSSCGKEERKDANAPYVNVQKQVVPEISTSDLDVDFDFANEVEEAPDTVIAVGDSVEIEAAAPVAETQLSEE